MRRKLQAIVHCCQAIPGVSGTVAQVGENGFGARWLFGNGGSGAVCDRPLVGMNRYRSEKPVQGGLDACPPRNELYQIFYNHQFDNQKHTRREHHFITFLQIFSVTNGI